MHSAESASHCDSLLLKDIQRGVRAPRPEGGASSRGPGPAGPDGPGASLEAAFPGHHATSPPPSSLVHRPQPQQVAPQIRRGPAHQAQLTVSLHRAATERERKLDFLSSAGQSAGFETSTATWSFLQAKLLLFFFFLVSG